MGEYAKQLTNVLRHGFEPDKCNSMEYWPQSQVIMTSAMVTFIALNPMGVVVISTLVHHGRACNDHCHHVNGHCCPHVTVLS